MDGFDFSPLFRSTIGFDRVTRLLDAATRPVLRPRRNADEYLTTAMDGDARRKLRSKEKGLRAAAGEIRTDAVESESELVSWIDDFLRLEAAGWKGAQGSALAHHPEARSYVVTTVHEAFARGRLMALTLRAGGRPIAVKLNLRSGDEWFAYKIAYDPEFARFSPHDAEIYPQFVRYLEESAAVVRQLLFETPVDPVRRSWASFKRSAALLWRHRTIGDRAYRMVDVYPQDAVRPTAVHEGLDMNHRILTNALIEAAIQFRHATHSRHCALAAADIEPAWKLGIQITAATSALC